MKRTVKGFIIAMLLITLSIGVYGANSPRVAFATTSPEISTPESVVALVTPANQPSNWAVESVARARELGLVTDEVNSSFQSATTRAEFSRLAMNFVEVLSGLESEAIFNGFPEDVQAATVFNDTNDIVIRTASGMGILNGTGNGNFTPNRALTRQEAATMLRNTVVVLLSGDELDVIPELQGLQPVAWTDAAQISSWARDATDVVFALGIMGGTSSTDLVFAPQSTFTREQAIVTFLNLWDWVQTTPIAEFWAQWNNGTEVDEIPTPTPDTPIPTPEPSAVTPEPRPTPQPPARQFNMNDPNVRLIPNFATSTTMEELRAAEEARLGVAHGGWQSAQEIIAHQRHPDNMIGDQTFYEWRMVPIQNWVDNYLRTNSIDISRMTDYEKTAVIRRIIEEGHLEAFIGLWRPNFRFGSVAGRGDCAPRSEAIHFMMIAMDFELFRQISGSVNLAHGFNAYWDSTVGAIRFVDADLGFGVWNLFIDELDSRGFSIWAP